MNCSQGLYWNQALKTCDFSSDVACKDTPNIPRYEGSTPNPLCPYPSGLYWNEDILACDYPPRMCRAKHLQLHQHRPIQRQKHRPHQQRRLQRQKQRRLQQQKQRRLQPQTQLPHQLQQLLRHQHQMQHAQLQKSETYLPNPDDCSSYYECKNGKALPQQCPGGTLWNEDIKNCDFAENVDCNM
ncbi:hypothetical protein NQ317_003949 [Molorchus minor]|uniref:Chitin-binding type-2 domain-containing protein n=1 Tax=Molorchus minor TaxID=1323400 RepID=A0ABQ9IRM9_9CUCU|nr:hypothetical protein NQ317_003949 [Molorchus minor]